MTDEAMLLALRATRGRLEMESARLFREVTSLQDAARRLHDRKLEIERDITALAMVTTEIERRQQA